MIKTLFVLILTSGLVQVAQGIDVLAYYFLRESYPRLQEAHSSLTHVSFDNFVIDNRGNVKGNVLPPSALTFAKEKGLVNYLCVNNYGPNDFNAKRIHRVLNNGKYRNRLISQLMKKVTKQGFNGINIDFEAIPARDRSKFTLFIRTLSAKLHAKNLELVISVPAKTEDNPKDSWSGAFNYRALGEAADLIQIMTYDEHGPWSNPGPISSLPWVKSCINYAKTVIPLEKISMGVPAYAYGWNTKTKKGYEVGWNEISETIGENPIEWDEEASSPFAYFQKNGKKHVIWFENKQSLRLKMDFAKQAGIKGVSVWALYKDNAQFWEYLLGSS